MKIGHLKKLQEHVDYSPYAGKMKNPDMHWEGENPMCGDFLAIDLKIKGGVIADARFTHRGCALSGAAASLFLDCIVGKPVAVLSRATAQKHLASLGVPVSAGRINCALLPLRGITRERKKR